MAVRGLIGVLPIEAEIDWRVLILLRNAIADQQGVERQIAIRQLAMKGEDSRSWFIYSNKTLAKYNLPDAHCLLDNTPKKVTWKRMVNMAIKDHWELKALQEAAALKSVRFMSSESLSVKKAAPLWLQSIRSMGKTKKAFVKARLLAGVYKLQSHEAQFRRNQHDTEPTCRLCRTGPEDRVHFLLHCPALEEYRLEYRQRLSNILDTHGFGQVVLSDAACVQVLLDPLHVDVPEEIRGNKVCICEIEDVSRDWVYKLHVMRWSKLHSDIDVVPGRLHHEHKSTVPQVSFQLVKYRKEVPRQAEVPLTPRECITR